MRNGKWEMGRRYHIFFLITFALIMQGTQIAGRLIRVCTVYKNRGATSDLKELMECAVSAS